MMMFSQRMNTLLDIIIRTAVNIDNIYFVLILIVIINEIQLLRRENIRRNDIILYVYYVYYVYYMYIYKNNMLITNIRRDIIIRTVRRGSRKFQWANSLFFAHASQVRSIIWKALELYNFNTFAALVSLNRDTLS